MFLVVLAALLSPVFSYEHFCRCQCDNYYEILSLGEKTCAECTKKFCSSLALSQCSETIEDDYLTSCFQKESLKDQLIVTLFVLVAIGLVLYATIVRRLLGKYRSVNRI